MISRRKFVRSMVLTSSVLSMGGVISSRSEGSRLAEAAPRPMPAGSTSPDDTAFWSHVREEFLIPREEVFFNTATLGSMPRSVVETVTRSTKELTATLAHWNYRPEHPDWFTGYRNFPSIMEKIAQLLHCDASEVCATQNATFGMNFIAQGIDLKPGDEIVQTDQEHPGGSCGWLERAQRHGAVYRTVAIPMPPNDPEEIVHRFAAVINSKTRVLAVPHMTSMLGLILPVKRLTALAREQGAKNIFVVLDGAQCVGHIPVDVRDLGCDAYYSSPHKWLLAPPGSGLLYIKKDRQSEIWTTLASTEWASYGKGAYRFMQYGSGSLSTLLGFEAAIDFHNHLGPERVTTRIKHLGDRLRAGLKEIKGTTIFSSVHPELCAGITTWRIDGMTGPQMMDRFWEAQKIRIRSMGDIQGVRQSTHIYNSEAEIEAVLALARQWVKRAA